MKRKETKMKTSKDMNQKAEQLMTELKDKAFKSHTPTPWEVDPENENSIQHALSKRLILHHVGAFDAAFIVRAVNAHEELVEVLGDLLDAVKITGQAKNIPQYVIQAQKVLAKAEGKE